jgi:KaiC/GvpD/RAD55 family RecA-like ATPase
MINKVFTGIEFIDKDIGGLYQYGAYLICGEKDTGKTILASRFLAEGLKKNEMCLFVTSEKPAVFISEIQNSLGFDFSLHIKTGVFSILEYERNEESPASRLKHYIDEVRAFVNIKGVERVVIDFSTVQDMLDEQKTEENIRGFVKALEGLHITTILVLDKSRSPIMFQVERLLIKETVGTFRLEKKQREKNGKYFYNMEVEKIAGHYPPFPSWEFEISKTEGFQLIVKMEKLVYSDIKNIKKTINGG